MIGASYNIAIGNLTDLYGICRVTLIGFIFPIPNFLHIYRGIRLNLAPKSQRALSIVMVPNWHGIEKIPRSFSFGAILWITVLVVAVMATISCSSNLLFLERISLRNFVKKGTLKYVKKGHGVCDCIYRLTPNDYLNLITILYKNFS